MRLERSPAVVVLGAVLIAASPMTAGGAARAGEDDVGSRAAITCPATGIRYLGTTAQGFDLCLTRSRNGSRLLAYGYSGTRCRGVETAAPFGWSASTRPPPVTVKRDGTFSHRTTGGRLEAAAKASFAGTFVGRSRARGTLRADVRLLLGGTCNTGNVRWSARRS